MECEDFLGGLFKGTDMVCDSVLCRIDGACCLPDGHADAPCADDWTFEECAAAGGLFRGYETECTGTDAVSCRGACCFEDGTFDDDTFITDCEDDGGDFQGFGKTASETACLKVVQCQDFNFIQNAEDRFFEFNKFDTRNGSRELQSVKFEIDSYIMLVAIYENVDNDDFQPTNAEVMEALQVDFSMDLASFFGLVPIDVINIPPFTIACNPTLVQPGGYCAFDSPYTFNPLQLWMELVSSPPTNLTPVVGAGGTFQFRLIGSGTVNPLIGGKGGVLADIHRAQGKITVTYCFAPLGTCCLPDGSCVDVDPFGDPGITEDECINTHGGTWSGDSIVCDPLGACCLPSGVCILTTMRCCTGAGGMYAGDDTVCDPGTCCLPTGECIETPEICCMQQGGTFGSVGSECAPQGACCINNGCIVTTRQCCEDNGGYYLADGTTCVMGACCLPNDVCEVRSQVCCEADNGVFLGMGTQCGEFGACCLDDGSCIQAWEACCESVDVHGGTFAGAGIACPGSGACCYDDGMTCRVESSICCQMNGGTYIGDGVPCGELGACCLPNGECEVKFQGCCDDIDGASFQGIGTDCITSTGACCLDAAGMDCIVTTQECCSHANGTFFGVGTDCGPIGSCCMDDGRCVEGLYEACCVGQGGTFRGPGSMCDQTGACCLDDQCLITTEDCCEGQMGEFLGVGTICNMGACCLPSGDCELLTEVCCIAMGGTYRGDNEECLPVGACCMDDGSCRQMAQTCCELQGGTFVGGPCGEPGACCLGNNVCMNTYAACCTNMNGLFYPGVNCDITGACCIGNGCEENVSQVCCEQEMGGTFLGSGSTCGATGACCLPSGLCIETTEECCVSPVVHGGEFIGGETCPGVTGACCMPDGTCDDNVSQLCCERAGGTFAGADSVCGLRRPCCLPDGTCDMLYEACCSLQLGTSVVDLLTCGDLGACCMDDGSCMENVFEACCLDMGGEFSGAGTVCGDMGACCMPDGMCRDNYYLACCNRVGGTHFPGMMCDEVEPCPVYDGGCAEKGSLLYISNVELRWDANGNLIQDTFIQLLNDYPLDVAIKLYFINGDPPLAADPATGERAHPGWNWLNNRITLTSSQPTYWSALNGIGGNGPSDPSFSPFTVLDPGFPPGRPDPEVPGERMLRGFIVVWAVDAITGEEIRWNHLAGSATVVHYRDGYAWEYRTCGFPVVADGVAHGQLTGMHPGELHLDGIEYRAAAAELLMNFQAVSSTAFSGPVLISSNTDLTLHAVSADLRQETDGPVTTKADIQVWNMNERKSSTHVCLTCWHQGLLSEFAAPNQFLLMTLGTDHGKARIDGLESALCDVDLDADGLPDVVSQSAALIGLTSRLLAVDAGTGYAADGTNLFDLGAEDAIIRYDPQGAAGEQSDAPHTMGELEMLLREVLGDPEFEFGASSP